MRMNKLAVTLSAVAAVSLAAIVFGAQRSSDRNGTITPWKAMSLAEARTGGHAVQATYEFEDGNWQYAVLVVAKHKLWEVEMNRNSGKIGDVETADPSGEAKEFEGDLKRAIR